MARVQCTDIPLTFRILDPTPLHPPPYSPPSRLKARAMASQCTDISYLGPNVNAVTFSTLLSTTVVESESDGFPVHRNFVSYGANGSLISGDPTPLHSPPYFPPSWLKARVWVESESDGFPAHCHFVSSPPSRLKARVWVEIESDGFPAHRHFISYGANGSLISVNPMPVHSPPYSPPSWLTARVMASRSTQ
ncbi:hypothetical protein B0H11DRAFT_1915898 [Mycena galericulata]|nr:hypothetical protein B0H11DRAFT_1915898 [Mycena galericulata]